MDGKSSRRESLRVTHDYFDNVVFFHAFCHVLSKVIGFLVFSENKKSSPNPFIIDHSDHFDDVFSRLSIRTKAVNNFLFYLDFLF